MKQNEKVRQALQVLRRELVNYKRRRAHRKSKDPNPILNPYELRWDSTIAQLNSAIRNTRLHFRNLEKMEKREKALRQLDLFPENKLPGRNQFGPARQK